MTAARFAATTPPSSSLVAMLKVSGPIGNTPVDRVQALSSEAAKKDAS
ncbi:MAG: hypothetical protein OTI35_16475 [Sulfitobacter sp.]|nr:hypothetical protein [Sulfitobacter sp.]